MPWAAGGRMPKSSMASRLPWLVFSTLAARQTGEFVEIFASRKLSTRPP
jgi:hypothetical protein